MLFRSVAYDAGRGTGLSFQDYRGTVTDFGLCVTSPANDGTTVDVDAQAVTNPGGKTPGGYSAARGVHMGRGALNFNTNLFIPAGNGRTNFIRLDTPDLLNNNFGRMRWRVTDATTAYHALRVNVDKRFSHNFQLSSAYTFSKTTDDTST